MNFVKFVELEGIRRHYKSSQRFMTLLKLLLELMMTVGPEGVSGGHDHILMKNVHFLKDFVLVSSNIQNKAYRPVFRRSTHQNMFETMWIESNNTKKCKIYDKNCLNIG